MGKHKKKASRKLNFFSENTFNGNGQVRQSKNEIFNFLISLGFPISLPGKSLKNLIEECNVNASHLFFIETMRLIPDVLDQELCCNFFRLEFELQYSLSFIANEIYFENAESLTREKLLQLFDVNALNHFEEMANAGELQFGKINEQVDLYLNCQSKLAAFSI